MRFRPLRPHPLPAAGLAPVPDPPATMRAVVFDGHRRPRRAARGIRSRPLPGPERAARARRGGGRQPHRREDPRRRGRLGGDRAVPGGARLRLQRHRGAVARTSRTRCRPAPPVFGMAAFPRSGGTYAEYAVVPSLSVARKPASLSHVEAAGVPLAALTAWGLVVETAHAHEGQRILIHAGSGGVGHFAVQFAAVLRRPRHRDRIGRNASWLRELGASVVDRLHDHPVRGRRRATSTSSSTSSATCTTTPARARSGCCVRAGSTSSCRPASWPGYADAAAAAGVRATSYKVIPDGGALATIARLLDSGSCRSTSTGCSTSRMPRPPTPSSNRATPAARSCCASATTDGAPGQPPTGEHPAPLGDDLVGDGVEQRRSAGSTAASRAARRRACRRARRARRARARPATGTAAAAPTRARAGPPSRSRSTPARSAAAARRDRRPAPRSHVRLQVVAPVEVDDAARRRARRRRRRRRTIARRTPGWRPPRSASRRAR